MNIRWLAIISGVLLILAIPSGLWPYGYYILLRWVVSISAIILAYNYYNSKLTAWTLVFGGIAFLFNPIFPIYLDKQTWVIIDLIVAIIFFIASGAIKEKHGK